ncbi:hypothetical protein DS2_02890 [Catenovulum agarivorans DS-2]|uniref:DUF1570 domain-containing protein n=1 Tax=Catenovulum agarivorans DS-2 TaxID=1328313 RepID=W7R280_9ALTE|nr:hypothetical protein [Catenovulum agarivorans]EWH11735.1 hypothetical protein DS2_02890 [Catenovulum agarivorans DS-2]
MAHNQQPNNLFTILFSLLAVIAALLFFLYPDTNQAPPQPTQANKTPPTPSVRTLDKLGLKPLETNDSKPAEQLEVVVPEQQVFDVGQLLANTTSINNCAIEKDEDLYQQVMYMLEDTFTQHDYLYGKLKINDTLSVQVIYPIGFNDAFWALYKNRLLDVLKVYSQELSFSLIKPTEIVLFLLPERDEYIDLLEQISFDGQSSIGVYFPYTNLAFVNLITLEQSVETAVHESIHRLNQYFFGFTARVINEGLAEYFESSAIQNYTIANELNKFEQQDYVLEPHELFTAYPSWTPDDYAALYFSAKLLTHYLITQTPQEFTQLMIKEAEDKCSPLPLDQYSQQVESLIIEQKQSYIEWRGALTSTQL